MTRVVRLGRHQDPWVLNEEASAVVAAVCRCCTGVRGLWAGTEYTLRGASKEESVKPPNNLKVANRREKRSQCLLIPQSMVMSLEEEEVVRMEGLAFGIRMSLV